MKVPDNLLYGLLIEQDRNIRKNLSEKALEISTGRRLRNISDDPLATFDILNIKREISQLSQYSQNRLFADTNLSYVEFNLGKIEDSLQTLYQKTIQAKNATIALDQLVSFAQEFEKILKFILDRVNDKLGQNYIFGGSSLTQRPFDADPNSPNYLGYTASDTPFEVWISENTKVEVFSNGGRVFSTNMFLSRVSFTDPQANFSNPGAITVQVGNQPPITINYGNPNQPQNLQELVDHINNNYSSSLRAFVSQNPDGKYSLMLTTTNLSDSLQVSIPQGDTGDFSAGFENPNILEWVDRLRRKLDEGLRPDDADLFAMKRSYDLVGLERSKVGSVLHTVKSLQPTQENLEDVLSKRKSDIEDAELSESIVEYTRYRLAYEALMKIVADQKDITILRYL